MVRMVRSLADRTFQLCVRQQDRAIPLLGDPGVLQELLSGRARLVVVRIQDVGYESLADHRHMA